MIVELRHLELFLAVAEEQQFTRAAERCHISQSALSTAIRTLERDLGAVLFLRTTRQVRLTDAGRALVGEARRTLAAARDARVAVELSHTEMRGTLSVGGVPTPEVLDQAELIAAFRRTRPGVTINYTRAFSSPLMEGVARGDIDVAFVTMPDRVPRGVVITPLTARRLVMACHPDHPLAKGASVDAAALVDEEFIVASPGSVGHDLVESVVAPGRNHLKGEFLVNDAASMLEFVAAGLGVTLLYGSIVKAHPGVVAVPVVPETMWTLAVAHAPDDLLGLVARAFIGLVNERVGTPDLSRRYTD
jgi:DNA-binding transcriptional LysR family regulator